MTVRLLCPLCNTYPRLTVHGLYAVHNGECEGSGQSPVGAFTAHLARHEHETCPASCASWRRHRATVLERAVVLAGTFHVPRRVDR